MTAAHYFISSSYTAATFPSSDIRCFLAKSSIAFPGRGGREKFLFLFLEGMLEKTPMELIVWGQLQMMQLINGRPETGTSSIPKKSFLL